MPLGGQQCPSDQCVGLKGADLISGLAGKVKVKKQMSSPSLTATIVVPLTKETINNHSGRQIRWCLYWRGSLCECVWVLLKQTLCSLWSYPELTKVWKKICSVLGLIQLMFLCLWGRWSDIWSVLWDHNFLNVLLYSQYLADFVSEPINSKANWFHLISGDYEYYPETCWMRSVKLASCDKTDLTPKYHHWCQTTMHWWAGGSNLDD